ncbi:MAG: periplasmic heavy metal sensor [Alphaproteobacteria bacterium]|nr:periplasmic heavy metal sensor [Alphaproteobacteria bacterium]
MNSRLIQVLLALSLLLNAFVLAGFVFRSWIAPPQLERPMPPPPPPGPRPSPIDIVVHELGLDDGQRQALRGLLDRYGAERRERNRDIQRLRDQLIDEYKRSSLDVGRIDTLIDQLGRLRTDQQKENLRILAQMEPRLNAEQRQRLRQIMVERFVGPPPPPPQ